MTDGPDPAPHRVVTTAGHVDHGKSTLVRALSGMEPDRLAEEQRRGLTIDLGFVWTTLSATAASGTTSTVAFVDVPGHHRFIETMLAGAGAAPAALLVVAADDGWSAQSAEHRDVLDLLGVPAVASVVTKADTVEPDRLAEVVRQVTAATSGTSLAGGPIVVTDAVSGRGIAALRQVLRDRLAVMARPVDAGRPRLWLDRGFTAGGVGTVVTGTLTEGRLTVDDVGWLMPHRRKVRIRRLQALGTDVEVASPGTRVAVNLAGIGLDEVTRGDALVVGTPWRATDEAELWVRVLDRQRVEQRGAWRLHAGTAAVTCRLLPSTGPIEGGGQGAVRVRLDSPLALVSGDRVVLREAGRGTTVAGGVVVDPAPARRIRGAQPRAAHAGRLADIASEAGPSGAPDLERRARRLVRLVALSGGSRDAGDARAAVGWPDDRALPTGLVEVGGRAVQAEVLARWTAAVSELGPGVHEREAVAARARRLGADGATAAALADHLVTVGLLVRTAHGVALPEHAESAGDSREARAAAVVAILTDGAFAPPDLADAAREVGLDHHERAALVNSGAVVRCGKVAFSRTVVDRAGELLRELETETGPFTASQARDTLRTSRRYVIPLLEHLARTGVTTFDGQHHRMR